MGKRARKTDSMAEEGGFEPSVPRKIDDAFETALFASAALRVPPERPTRSREGLAVRILFPPPASLFSPVPSRATGSEPRGLAAVCAWVETEKGTGRPRLVLLGPFSLSGFDAVPLRESYSERPRVGAAARQRIVASG
jgi:hypothetical protein